MEGKFQTLFGLTQRERETLKTLGNGQMVDGLRKLIEYNEYHRSNEFSEEIADLCHRQWSHWMKYLFSKCVGNTDARCTDDDELVIPGDLVRRWYRQIATDYADLSESEKDSDRRQAKKFLDVIRNA